MYPYNASKENGIFFGRKKKKNAIVDLVGWKLGIYQTTQTMQQRRVLRREEQQKKKVIDQRIAKKEKEKIEKKKKRNSVE